MRHGVEDQPAVWRRTLTDKAYRAQAIDFGASIGPPRSVGVDPRFFL